MRLATSPSGPPSSPGSEPDALRPVAALLPLSGAALYSTLLRAVLDRDIDVTKVSIDSLSRPEVVDAYGDLGVSGRSVRVMPYDGSASVGRFAKFHRKLHARGTTSLALTTVRSVAERLDDAGVPVMRMAPTSATIRSGLNHAVLMGLGSQLEGAQTAICIVELMSSTDAGRAASTGRRTCGSPPTDSSCRTPGRWARRCWCATRTAI